MANPSDLHAIDPELRARVAEIIAAQHGPSWEDDADRVIAEVLAWHEAEWVMLARLK